MKKTNVNVITIDSKFEKTFVNMTAAARSQFIKSHIGDLTVNDLLYLKTLAKEAERVLNDNTKKTVKHRSLMCKFNAERRERCIANGEKYHSIDFLIKQIERERAAESEKQSTCGCIIPAKSAGSRSTTKKKKVVSEETKAKMKAAWVSRRNRGFSAETRAKMSAKAQLRWKDESPRKNLSIRAKERWANPENRARYIESKRKLWADPVYRYRQFGYFMSGMEKARVKAAKEIVELAR